MQWPLGPDRAPRRQLHGARDRTEGPIREGLRAGREGRWADQEDDPAALAFTVGKCAWILTGPHSAGPGAAQLLDFDSALGRQLHDLLGADAAHVWELEQV